MAITEVIKGNPVSSVSGTKNYLDSLGNGFLVTPKHSEGIAGFVFDYEGETAVQLEAEITDHYSEDNTVLNDHVAIRPIRITLRGFIAELKMTEPQGLAGDLNFIQTKLTTVNAYLGKYTPGGIAAIQRGITKAQNITNTIQQTVSRIKNVIGFFKKSTPAKTKQQIAYEQLSKYFAARIPMLIVTRFATIPNMMIEHLSMIQDETTKDWCDISVTLKEVRFIDSAQASPDKNLNRNLQQSAGLKNQIPTRGKKTALASILDGGVSAIKNNPVTQYFLKVSGAVLGQ